MFFKKCAWIFFEKNYLGQQGWDVSFGFISCFFFPFVHVCWYMSHIVLHFPSRLSLSLARAFPASRPCFLHDQETSLVVNFYLQNNANWVYGDLLIFFLIYCWFHRVNVEHMYAPLLHLLFFFVSCDKHYNTKSTGPTYILVKTLTRNTQYDNSKQIKVISQYNVNVI